MKYTFYLFMYSIYKLCVWIYIFQKMAIKMLWNNKIQIIFILNRIYIFQK
jgi:hypothetical protein